MDKFEVDIKYTIGLDMEPFYITKEDIEYPEYLEDAIHYNHTNYILRVTCVILSMDENEDIREIIKICEIFKERK